MSDRVGGVRWGVVAGTCAVLAVVLAVCVSLGTWQWRVGTEEGTEVAPAAAVPLADALAPASASEPGVGKSVTVTGEFAEDDAALVGGGRVIDGVEAVLVVRPFTVAADATGTGEEATLPVVVGWLPADKVDSLGGPSTATDLSGYLRGAEGASVLVEEGAPAGTFWADTLSPAVFAQAWESPLYSALLVTDEPEAGLNPIPEPTPEHEAQLPLDRLRPRVVAVRRVLPVRRRALDTGQWPGAAGRGRLRAARIGKRQGRIPVTSPATRPAVTPGAVTRYKVMAIITGTLLILVFLGMLRYLPGLDSLEEQARPHDVRSRPDPRLCLHGLSGDRAATVAAGQVGLRPPVHHVPRRHRSVPVLRRRAPHLRRASPPPRRPPHDCSRDRSRDPASARPGRRLRRPVRAGSSRAACARPACTPR
ncbi:hypothetical protein GCM10025876_25280 [Demequina litorisediminis]|uniref:SURF1-like protein n=1 Tax=Demequina litorisediminis TaxID=1849022 RepID=A0ABQ6IEM2_9MICO|nr:hypothetical protein GCM10025876_25280 [Demequina litorisediminis]